MLDANNYKGSHLTLHSFKHSPWPLSWNSMNQQNLVCRLPWNQFHYQAGDFCHTKKCTLFKIDEQQIALLANICQSQSTHNVCSDGLNLVAFTPVHIWPTCHTCCIECMRGLCRCYICLQLCPILQPARSILIQYPLLLAYLSKKTTNPTSVSID